MFRAALSFRVAVVLSIVAAVIIFGRRGEAQVRAALVQLVNPPLAPTKPSDLVTIRSTGALCGSSPWRKLDQRVNPDGTLSPFVIPDGQVLIVTSVDWRQGLTDGAGYEDEFFLFPSAANININYNIVYSMGAPGSSNSRAGQSIVVTGVAIAAGNPCWGVNHINHMGSADALVHGFLTPAL